MANFNSLILGALVGAGLTAVAFTTLVDKSVQTTEADAEKKPLYWVAPMDPNYRRDKPGKSPMGMDLIPVYEDSAGDGPDEGPGTITVAPEVVNNLGVRTATVEHKALKSQIKTVGYVRYDEDQLVHVHPRVEGWIEKLYVKAAGDPVEKGQPLYDIYSPALVNAQEEYLLALDRKNRRLITAARDRLHALQLPKSTIDKVTKTRKVLQYITLYAPQTGVIDNLNIREGFYVKPGTTLMSVGTLDQVWVNAEIFERQAFGVSVGMPVTMMLDFLPGRRWRGQVDYIYPTLDSKTRTVKVRLRFDNPDKALKPNMFAQVTIDADNQSPGLLVPKEAVIRSGNSDRVVLALGEGRFKSVNVTLGRFDDTHFEILSGLNEGESIVVSAQFLLDSESGKTSDFKRMEAMAQDNQATVSGVINDVMTDKRMLNISRGPIEKWGRAAATMDFLVAGHINLNHFSSGVKVTFTFEIKDGDFIIIDMRPEAGQ